MWVHLNCKCLCECVYRCAFFQGLTLKKREESCDPRRVRPKVIRPTRLHQLDLVGGEVPSPILPETKGVYIVYNSLLPYLVMTPSLFLFGAPKMRVRKNSIHGHRNERSGVKRKPTTLKQELKNSSPNSILSGDLNNRVSKQRQYYIIKISNQFYCIER